MHHRNAAPKQFVDRRREVELIEQAQRPDWGRIWSLVEDEGYRMQEAQRLENLERVESLLYALQDLRGLGDAEEQELGRVAAAIDALRMDVHTRKLKGWANEMGVAI